MITKKKIRKVIGGALLLSKYKWWIFGNQWRISRYRVCKNIRIEGRYRPLYSKSGWVIREKNIERRRKKK